MTVCRAHVVTASFNQDRVVHNAICDGISMDVWAQELVCGV